MTVTIRKIENTEREYFAYTKSFCGKATYFLYFTDDLHGAIVLHNFVEMLRKFFEQEKITVKVKDTTVKLKNEYLLSIFQQR